MSLPQLSPNAPKEMDPALAHNAITALHAFYTDLINYFVGQAMQQRLQSQVELSAERDAHAKTKILLAQAQKDLDGMAVLEEPYPVKAS